MKEKQFKKELVKLYGDYKIPIMVCYLGEDENGTPILDEEYMVHLLKQEIIKLNNILNEK